jgi:surface antigen
VVDTKPSSHLDDLFGFGVPEFSNEVTPPIVYATRREMREAEARSAQSAARVSAPEAVFQGLVPGGVALPSPAVMHPTRRSAAAAAAPKQPAAKQTAPKQAGSKLKRTEASLVRASGPRPPRKNPLSVLVTMAAVGGMFAVAGLPAYALTPVSSVAGATKTEADAQTLAVSAQAAQLAPVRDGYHASTQADIEQMLKDSLRAAQNEAYNASGARALGDDYPWPYELRDYQGGGLSPLNYYYRECVDFVAWRLNRDAGYYSAPFKWVWTTLTPLGGNASQWRYNWEAKGWPTSNTPIAGSVAWFYGNHVAYVKTVNADGTVLIEEYNWGGNGMYGQRTIPAASVPIFLYPPPAG